MLANVAVKISVFNNSNLIYTGLMFGGSLGLYAGLRFNEYSIVYNVWNKSSLNTLIEHYLNNTN